MTLLACAVAAGLSWWAGIVRAETTAGSGAIEITSLPCQITTSGNYFLKHDLSINADIAYAIKIAAPNVTLDLNGHAVRQLYANDNGTIGIYTDPGAYDVTVRNGTLTGFLIGMQCWGDHTLVEDVAVQATTFAGISIAGTASCVRHCRVSNVGGEQVQGLAPYAIGINVQGGSDAVVIDSDVTTLTPGPNCYTVCIHAVYAANVLVVDNRMSASTKGCEFVYCTGTYRDNLCAGGIGVNYDVLYTSVTDAGNNQ